MPFSLSSAFLMVLISGRSRLRWMASKLTARRNTDRSRCIYSHPRPWRHSQDIWRASIFTCSSVNVLRRSRKLSFAVPGFPSRNLPLRVVKLLQHHIVLVKLCKLPQVAPQRQGMPFMHEPVDGFTALFARRRLHRWQTSVPCRRRRPRRYPALPSGMSPDLPWPSRLD